MRQAPIPRKVDRDVHRSIQDISNTLASHDIPHLRDSRSLQGITENTPSQHVMAANVCGSIRKSVEHYIVFPSKPMIVLLLKTAITLLILGLLNSDGYL